MNSTLRFASKLHPLLGKSNENSFYAPFSLLSALGMCQAGAKTQTRADLSKTLESPKGEKANKKFFRDLVAEVTGDGKDRKYELVTANALWVQQNLKLNEQYQKIVRNDYGGSLTEVDYEGNPDAAVSRINGWCNENTRGKIPTIITRDFISKGTLLILTNAIYFKGKWESAFDKKNTRPQPFEGAGKVPTMNQSGSFTYGENDSFQSLNLDYQGDDLAMLVVLPRAKTTDGLDADLEGTFTAACDSLHYEETVNVSLPKFKMETQYKVGDALKELGAGLAFSNDADFSGITTEAPLKISEVVHKAFVECDEEGTEAAAATAVGMMKCTSTRMPSPPKVFNADHPFVFFIYNKKSNNVLFAGRVVKPA